MPDMKTLTIDDTKFDVVDAKAVHFTEQTLTEEQKAQVRENIGVGDGSNVEPAEDDIPKVFINGTIPTTKTEVQAEMEYISKTERFKAFLKIKCQGSSSMNYPKKNFTIKMYSDDVRESKLKKAFKEWGHESNKYVLKANYIDHSHSRNIVCARLWGEVVSSRTDYDSLPDELKNSPNNGAVDGFPVKVYANGVYQGLYTWNIGKDDWMFGMDENNANHVVLCAETNTNSTYAETPCNFRALWDGVNEKNWSVEVGTNSDAVKNSLNALISCVKDTDDATFRSTIGNYLDVQSAIDYYIHQYIICGFDALARNMLLLTYNGTKWHCSAYDMDCTFGGTMGDNYFVPYNTRVPEDCNEKYSLLWSRIEEVFSEKLISRYDELRKSVYSVSNIVNHFERFTDIIGNDLYAEDGEVYPDIISLGKNNIKQIRDFTVKRLGYCDGEFAEMMVTPIRYLESYGKEWIDTGISGGENASYELTVAHTSTEYTMAASSSLFGGAQYGVAPLIRFYNWDGFHVIPGGTDSFNAHIAFLRTNPSIVGIRYDSDGKVYVKWDDYDWSETTYVTGEPSKVAGRGWGGKNWYVFNSPEMSGIISARLYYLKMYTDGVLVRDFIPVRHRVEGVYGLFDKVTKTFFGNNGTGELGGA